jgi:hypothetical protein
VRCQGGGAVMEKRRRRKHRAHKRVLVVANQHRAYLETTPSGSNTLATLDRAVADEAAEIGEQDSCRTEQQVATDRCTRGRKALHDGVKYVAIVSPLVTRDNAESAPLDGSSVRADEELIARAENVHTAASAHAELFVNKGVQPGFLDQLANELTAFKKAKDAQTLVVKRYTEANERFDHALDEGDKAVAILESLFTTSADAPVGALTALKQAKLIGPRAGDATSQPGGTNPAPAPEPPAAPAATTSHAEHAATEPPAPDTHDKVA